MRNRRATPAFAALLLAAGSALAAPAADPIAAAVGDATRLASERERDGVRHPAETLAFSGVKPGDHVLELMPGRGYYTHLFCRIVGPQGHVTTLGFPRDKPKVPPPGAAPGAAPGGPPPGAPPEAAEPADTACGNVDAQVVKLTDVSLAGGYDIAWTSENYHDLNNLRTPQADVAEFNRKVFAALKPGGAYLIEDHVAAPGTTLAQGDPLHRIDPAIVRAQLEAAGFIYEGESTVLRNPDDDHAGVPFGLQGRSDKFLYRFRKPAH